MKTRGAFTLIEVMVAVLIFSYMIASLATIYSTSQRHFFQNYRSDVIKTGVVVAMKALQNTLPTATRIDWPARNARDTVLKFASNVDQLTGCYPINPALPSTWYLFCLGNDASTPGYQSLYYYNGNVGGSSAATACGKAAPAIFNPNLYYAVPNCGGTPGATKLMQYAVPSAGYIFSRIPADGAAAPGAVRVSLRSFWQATAHSFGRAQHDVDFSMNTLLQGQVPYTP